MVGCVLPSPRPAASFTAPECGPKVCPQPPAWAEPGLHPCFAAYSHIVDAMLTLDVLLMFDSFESQPPVPLSLPAEDPYGLGACRSTIGFVAAGEVAGVVTWMMQVLQCLQSYAITSPTHSIPSSMFLQRNPKLSCVFASRAPLADVPGALYKLQKLDPDAQGQVFAEMVLPPDMAARRPMMVVEWKETCHCLSGCSPIPPLLQGFSRSSTSLQVYNHTASALSWIKLLTSETIILATANSNSMNPLTGLRIYDVIISTPAHDPAHHLLAIKVQVNGSLYVSVPQAVTLTPGACEHVYRIGVDEALGRFVDALAL